MINRSAMPAFSIAAALVLSACGGSDSSTPADPTVAGGGTETTVDAPTETTAVVDAPTETIAVVDPLGGGEDAVEACGDILTPDQIDSILGTSVAITGSANTCTLKFASDAFGSLQAFDGSRGDEAIERILEQFADGQVDLSAELLPDDRGLVSDYSVIVRGASGSVYRMDTPRNLETPDIGAAMQEIADLLLTR